MWESITSCGNEGLVSDRRHESEKGSATHNNRRCRLVLRERRDGERQHGMGSALRTRSSLLRGIGRRGEDEDARLDTRPDAVRRARQVQDDLPRARARHDVHERRVAAHVVVPQSHAPDGAREAEDPGVADRRRREHVEAPPAPAAGLER